MKKPFVALLLLAGAAAMLASTAFAKGLSDTDDTNFELYNAAMAKKLAVTGARGLRTSAAQVIDTAWVGHSYQDHVVRTNPGTASEVITDNYWNLWAGKHRPGVALNNNAIWDWDHATGFGNNFFPVADSLAGWWPFVRRYFITGGLVLNDKDRPWWCTDYGNQTNHVVPAGPGGKRAKGVVGVWHADAGKNAGTAVQWTPLSGTKSAWCGLRQTGDLSYSDIITGNPFNAQIDEFNLDNYVGQTTGAYAAPNQVWTNKNFPGYCSQWDQMLYRDFQPADNTPLTISFEYATRMSTNKDIDPSTRSGWFHGDPSKTPTLNDGNFISSSDAGANAPVDSFQVYVGAPAEGSVRLAHGLPNDAIYDPLRRWFSEVIRIWDGTPYYQLMGAAGENPADTLGATPVYSGTLTGAQVHGIITAPGNTFNILRLVFRVKTNRNFDDETFGTFGYTSSSRGAAMVDSVTVGGSLVGTFENVESASTPQDIDNRTTFSALTRWKSTGKPPQAYWHAHALAAGLAYDDLCGSLDTDQCNMLGVVISAGNHDDGESSGERRPNHPAQRERIDGILSPTVNLLPGPLGVANAMGISSTTLTATTASQLRLRWDIYSAVLNLPFTANAFQRAVQSYPSRQNNLGTCWGDLRFPAGQTFNPDPQCFQQNSVLSGEIRTARGGTVIPDSIRIGCAKNQQCFRFGVSTLCGSPLGFYLDNVSLGIVSNNPGPFGVSATNAAPSITHELWQGFNDAFTVNNGLIDPASTLHDTTTAVIKGGLNNSLATGNIARPSIPADTIAVAISAGSSRCDLIFRILPGPGNYRIGAGRTFPPAPTQELLELPTDTTHVVGISETAGATGPRKFWSSFIADPGTFGNAHVSGGAGKWDYLAWNSARMDTVDTILFPVIGKVGVPVSTTVFSSTFHESDPHLGTVTAPILGIPKRRCFMNDPTGPVSADATLDNITCISVPAWVTSAKGYDGQPLTVENTKIIPDGLLTPGSHVEYAFRASATADPPTVYRLGPDTTNIWPQATSSGDFDAHRWQEFSVLPDRYKDPAFGGQAMACMLYYDLNDRRQDETSFVAMMDSIGGTSLAKQGAHNGYKARGDIDINFWGGLYIDSAPGAGDGVTGVTPVFENRQPGTTWDMYGMKASESLNSGGNSIGQRLVASGATGYQVGKDGRVGPQPDQLRQYKVVAVLSGDLNSGQVGPWGNRGERDANILVNFLDPAQSGSPPPRGLLLEGHGFAENEKNTYDANTTDNAIHNTLMANFMGATLRDPSYQLLSGNQTGCADLLTTAQMTGTADIYGNINTCFYSADVLVRNGAVSEAADVMEYENTGANAPVIPPPVAAVKHTASVANNWVGLMSALDILNLTSRYCDSGYGRLVYYYNMLNTVFGSICQLGTGTPALTLDTPQNPRGNQFVNFMKLGSNPMTASRSKVFFGLAKTDRVQVRVYDVSGRLIRTLADRTFQAGNHSIEWDGTADNGARVARGVYFTQVSSKTYTSAQKLTVLQ